MHRELPSGTVTLLFTDIEGSTRLLIERGDGYRDLLASHHEVVRSAIAAHGGVEVGTEGDAFFVVFEHAEDAVAAAVAALGALADGPVRVRVGLHTGSPSLTPEGYVGLDVHRAARISAAAHGGQILLSRATRDLLGDGGPPLRDLGEHRLKDLAEPEWLYQVGDAAFPPVRSLAVTNLPSRVTSFVGRHRELAAAGRLLADGHARLLTLVGPGGVGKTSLAVELARGLAAGYPNGVFFVPCAALREPASVLAEIGRVVGAGDEGATDFLRSRKTLLVVDNLEQVVASAARELAKLLQATDGVDVLGTSREPLRIAGEHAYEVPPLQGEEGELLFVERAAAAGAHVTPGDVVERIVRRLDGLPLAVELAAARAPVLAPAQLLGRLERRLDLLRGTRDADDRHATLRAAIEWSHALLGGDEQGLFARLAIFAGGSTLELAERICCADLDSLVGLVEKSLLRRSDRPTGPRFWMLETIHAYASERLAASGEEAALRRRHAEAIADLVEDSSPAPTGDDPPPEWGARVEADLDNLRAAIRFATEDGDAELSRLVWFAWPIAYRLGLLRETAEWLEAAIDRCLDEERKARLSIALAGNAYLRGGYERALAAAEEALDLTRRGTGDRTVEALDQMALACAMLGEHQRSAALHDEALELARLRAPGVELFRLYVNVGGTALARGDCDRTIRHSQEAIDLAARLWPERAQPVPLCNKGFALLETGRYEESRRAYEDSLRGAVALPMPTMIAYAFLGLAALAAETGDASRAARLAGTADQVAANAGLEFDPVEADRQSRTLAAARAALGHEFDEWYAAGRGADPFTVAELTLAGAQAL